jgi:hypothetical protein
MLLTKLLAANDVARGRLRHSGGTQFTCFTGTKVQVLMLEALQDMLAERYAAN